MLWCPSRIPSGRSPRAPSPHSGAAARPASLTSSRSVRGVRGVRGARSLRLLTLSISISIPLALVALVGAPPRAEAARRPRPISAALVSLERDAPDPTQTRRLLDALATLSGRVEGFTYLTGAALGSRLGTNPREAVARCGADIACIARIGQRAGVRRVVVLRLSPAEGSGPESVRAQFAAILTRRATLQGRVDLDITPATDLEAVLGPLMPDLFGVSLAPATGEDPELVAAGSAQAPSEDPTLELPLEPVLELAPLAPAREVEAAPVPRFVFWGGVATTAAAAVTLGIGAGLGASGQAAGASIGAAVPLPEAQRLERQANQQIDSANVLMGIAAAAGALGLTGVLVGLFGSDVVGGESAPAGPAALWTW